MAKQRILLVEDEEFLREIYQDVLSQAGYIVDIAVDGDEAFAALHKGGYDLVLLDVMLPERDGRTVLIDLQKQPSLKPNPKIFYMTNLSHDGILNEGKKIGASGVLIKSDLNPDQFLQKVKQILDS